MALASSLSSAPLPAQLRYTISPNAQNLFSTDVSGTTQAATGTKGLILYGNFIVNLQGTFTATVSIQRSTDNGTTWYDLTTGINSASAVAMTNVGQRAFFEPCRNVLYRVGVKTGNFSSGPVIIEIQQ